ncbi:MAG TPA: aminoglycoside adenylyltransferase domain-containing protein [Chloroflexota bacterium]|nr:aminoglycoside adenylyltransferase domain-containing protein [Chloroflexota bacterium]
MLTTPSADVQRMLTLLRARIRRVLGDKLSGLYLTGSLVTGDFDDDVSDIDLVAVTSTSLGPTEINALGAMHRAIAVAEKRWDNRIEVVYLTTDALRTYRTRTSTIAVTSPGEPFHTRDAGKDWLINWYVVREKGVTLFGPSPKTLIDPISPVELVQAVQDSARAWRDWIKETEPRHRNAQVYAILTMCRALNTFNTGGYLSKRQAALWAQQHLPAWASIIRRALVSWRDDWYRDDVDHGATLSETVRFVNAVVDQIVR